MKTQKKRGFTLVEVLIAVTIIGLVIASTTSVTVQMLNTYYYDAGRLLINGDMRKLTRDMTTDAVYANYFVIYPSFGNRTTTATVGNVTNTVDNFVTNGSSGDMVVLVTVNTDPANGTSSIVNLTGYYRDPADGLATTLGPVRKFKVAVNPPSTSAVYSLLNTLMPVANAHTNPDVIPLAMGQSNGELFYNYYGRCIMIKSKIVEPGNEHTPQATHTYNFTVAPRG